MRPVYALVAALVLVLSVLVECRAQGLRAAAPAAESYGSSFSLGIKKFVNSFTSYQFPNPFPPEQDPLSRLEFPIDQWFVGVSSGYATRYCSFRSQFWTNVNREGRLKMQDSDWDDESRPFQKTIFSESNCRLNRGLLADIGASAATPLSGTVNMEPVFGFRYQYFFFTTHDGFQDVLGGSTVDLTGDGIDFRQTFYHWYLGARYGTGFSPASALGLRWPATVEVQLDYGLVNAKNEDLHLLRAGERVTEERTRGHCWHVSINLDISVSDSFRAGIEADFKRLMTGGSHRLTNPLFSIDFSFSGSKVWSDQASISAVGLLIF
ncbi:MAG: omptin family outer membrane protease [Deltaproteobacteria bacterium]|nr:omptin family outer membrane protease [Deltaproteobacteria bacterium]